MDRRLASFNFHGDDSVKTIVRAIVECNGNLLQSAHHLGIHRSHLYRLIYKLKLWPVVNKVRHDYVIERSRKKRLIGGVYV